MNYREVMSRLNHSLNLIDSAYAAIARKYNLTFNALMIVYLIEESETITQKQICDELHLPKSTVHSILMDFIKQEHVILIAGSNKKEKNIVFTEKGAQYFKTILQETQLFEDKILAALGDNTCIYLVETVEKLGVIIKEELPVMNHGKV